MKIQDLLYPRFEVIANYPLSPYTIGHIIDNSPKDAVLINEDADYLRTYKAAFREMEWYEHRIISDFLLIDKIILTKSVKYVIGAILPVTSFIWANLDTIKPIIAGFNCGMVEVGFSECMPTEGKITVSKP
jgi:hypothetical protein